MSNWKEEAARSREEYDKAALNPKPVVVIPKPAILVREEKKKVEVRISEPRKVIVKKSKKKRR